MAFRNPILAGTTLVRAAMQSSNFAAGSAGWQISRAGGAEFNNITIRGGQVVGGTALYYSGTPAAGNLIASISAAAGTDSYGNNYGAGICSYDQPNQLFSQLLAGKLVTGTLLNLAGNPLDTADAGSLVASLGAFNAEAVMQSPLKGGSSFTDRAQLQLSSGQPNMSPGSSTNPIAKITDTAGNSAVDLQLSGALVKAGLTGTPVTWQTPTFSTGWSGTTSFDGLGGGEALRFRKMAEDDVWLYGLATAASGATTTVATLPSGYYSSTHTTYGHAIRNRASVIAPIGIAISSAGVEFTTDSPQAGDEYMFNVRIPLENLP